MERGNILEYLKECFLNIIYPKPSVCLSCTSEEVENYICKQCEGQIALIPGYTMLEDIRIYSCAYYAYTIKKLIFNLKYKSDFNSGVYLSKLMLDKIEKENIKFNYITYVPTSRKKLKQRGFNQCEYLAKELSKDLNIPYIKLLGKKESVKEQKSLNKNDREINMKDAYFILSDNINIKGRLLLIDDIMTTGATIKACITELRKIKNLNIQVITIGKSINEI